MSWAWPNGANCFRCSPAGGVLIALGRWGCCCCYPGAVGCSWWGKEFGLHYHSDSLLLEGNRDSLQQQFPLEAVWGMWNYLWKSSLQCLRGNRDWKQQNSSHALDLKNRQKGAQVIQWVLNISGQHTFVSRLGGNEYWWRTPIIRKQIVVSKWKRGPTTVCCSGGREDPRLHWLHRKGRTDLKSIVNYSSLDQWQSKKSLRVRYG